MGKLYCFIKPIQHARPSVLQTFVTTLLLDTATEGENSFSIRWQLPQALISNQTAEKVIAPAHTGAAAYVGQRSGLSEGKYTYNSLSVLQ